MFTTAGLVGEAADWSPATAGIRGGFAWQERGEDIKLAEVFAGWELPWQWQWNNGWRMHSQLVVATGWLGGHGQDAFMASLGPSLAFGWRDVPVWLECGISPTALSRHTFGSLNLGGDFHFTSYAGVNWQVTRRVGVGYRFQHLSNAGFWTPNPGLNLHAISLYWCF